ncbi:MAG TPA: RNA 2',3'-cyclic phosphodiesterase [Acidimicrobiales bacterium]
MRRLFVAVWPPAALVDQLRALERPVRSGLRWTTPDQWHITLRFVGSVDDTAEAQLRDALTGAAAGAGSADASAGPRLRALGNAVWVLPVTGLDSLAQIVQQATGDIGRPPARRPFRGHVTVARARHSRGLAGLPAGSLSAQWTVDELTLVASDLHRDGARYHVVGRWPLTPTVVT